MGTHSEFRETLCLKGFPGDEQLGASRSCGVEGDGPVWAFEGPIG